MGTYWDHTGYPFDAMPAGPVKDAAMAKLERKRAKASSSTTVDVEYETMEYIDEKGRKIKKKVKKTTTSTNAGAMQQQLEQDGTGTPNTVKAEGPVAQATLTVVCARLGLLWAGFGWSRLWIRAGVTDFELPASACLATASTRPLSNPSLLLGFYAT